MRWPPYSRGVRYCRSAEQKWEEVTAAAIAAIRRADTLIVGGTSLTVWPAAGLVDYFSGDTLIVMNKTPTPADAAATLVVREGIAESFRRAYPELES